MTIKVIKTSVFFRILETFSFKNYQNRPKGNKTPAGIVPRTSSMRKQRNVTMSNVLSKSKRPVLPHWFSAHWEAGDHKQPHSTRSLRLWLQRNGMNNMQMWWSICAPSWALQCWGACWYLWGGSGGTNAVFERCHFPVSLLIKYPRWTIMIASNSQLIDLLN